MLGRVLLDAESQEIGQSLGVGGIGGRGGAAQGRYSGRIDLKIRERSGTVHLANHHIYVFWMRALGKFAQVLAQMRAQIIDAALVDQDGPVCRRFQFHLPDLPDRAKKFLKDGPLGWSE